MAEDVPGRQNQPERARSVGPQPLSVDAATLFGGSREIIIVHNGERYRLRVTQNGKLILTK